MGQAIFEEAFASKVKELGDEGSAPTPSKTAAVSSPASKGGSRKSGLGEMKKVLKKVSELVDEEECGFACLRRFTLLSKRLATGASFLNSFWTCPMQNCTPTIMNW